MADAQDIHEALREYGIVHFGPWVHCNAEHRMRFEQAIETLALVDHEEFRELEESLELEERRRKDAEDEAEELNLRIAQLEKELKKK